jgi:hypothetical protein
VLGITYDKLESHADEFDTLKITQGKQQVQLTKV